MSQLLCQRNSNQSAQEGSLRSHRTQRGVAFPCIFASLLKVSGCVRTWLLIGSGSTIEEPCNINKYIDICI